MAATTKTNMQLVFNGLLNENPIFRLALSMCPAVGISTTVANGLLLGVAVLFVQVFSSCTISMIKDYIHPRIRIPTYTLTIATSSTITGTDAAAFSVETALPLDIPAGTSATLTIGFAPNGAEGILNAVLEIASNDTSDAVTIVALGLRPTWRAQRGIS